jgi:hypothetical protein
VEEVDINMKVRLSAFCEENQLDRNKTKTLLETKYPEALAGRGWLNEKGQKWLLDRESEEQLYAFVLCDAPNPRFVIANLDGPSGSPIKRISVKIPRQYSGRLKRKKIKVELRGDKYFFQRS